MRGAASADHPQTAVQLAVLVFLVATLPHATHGLPVTQLTGSEESNVIAIAIQADVNLLPTPRPGTGDILSTRQRVACDICLKRVSSCENYIPDANMFNATRPSPEQNLGKLVECKPSEREYWTTVGRFKIGDAAHAPAEARSGCPDAKRVPFYDGLAENARKMCNLFSSSLPKTSSDSACSAFVNDKAAVDGRVAQCASRYASA